AMVVYLKGREKALGDELVKEGKISAEEAKESVARVEAGIKKIIDKVQDDEKIDLNLDSAMIPRDPEEARLVEVVIATAKTKAEEKVTEKWGLLGSLGLNKKLSAIDDSSRSRFTPYGLSGVMLGAALVFFAFIGFDSISTHAEEAKRPQRD